MAVDPVRLILKLGDSLPQPVRPVAAFKIAVEIDHGLFHFMQPRCSNPEVRMAWSFQCGVVVLLQYILPAAFLVMIFFFPKGALKTLDKLNESEDDKKTIKNLVASAQSTELKRIRDSFPNSSGKDADYIYSKIQNAIHYGINRHDWYETQRGNMFKAILAIGGIAFTAMGIYIRTRTELEPTENALIVGLSFTALISVVYSVLLYNTELDQDRTYRLVSDIRYWYFRYNLPKKARNVKESEQITTQARAVLRERDTFLNRVSAVSTP